MLPIHQALQQRGPDPQRHIVRRDGGPDNHLLQGGGPLRDVELRPVQVRARGLWQPVLQ